MSRGDITIDSKKYRLARTDTRLPSGARRWQVTARASQRGDGLPWEAEWKLDGPCLASTEVISPGDVAGFLGPDYTQNADTRWNNTLCLSPLRTSVTLSTYDVSWTAAALGVTFTPGSSIPGAPVAAANTNGVAIGKSNGTSYAHFIRGGTSAKVALSDMTLVKGGRYFPERPVSILATKTDSGAPEISVGMRNEGYQVLSWHRTPPTPDSWQTNADYIIAPIIAQAQDRVMLAGKNNTGYGVVVAGNILSGGITMAHPNVNDISTIQGEDVLVTGFAMDGPFWVVFTNKGPFLIDDSFRTFFNMLPETAQNASNGVGSTTWGQHVIINSSRGTRWQRNGTGARFGVERFTWNTSPVQGTSVAGDGNENWFYQAIDNGTDTYIVAWRPREVGDYFPSSESGLGREFAPFTVAYLASTRCELVKDLDDVDGLRTNPTVVLGSGSNIEYFTQGRTIREIDDSNYRFASSGTWYGTKTSRLGGVLVDLDSAEYKVAHATSTATITVGVSVDGGTAVTLTPETTTGYKRRYFVSAGIPLTTVSGYQFKPQVALTTTSSSVTPKLEGVLRLTGEMRQTRVREMQFVVVLETNAVSGSWTKAETLLADWQQGAVLIRDDAVKESWYAKVKQASIVEIEEKGPDGKPTPVLAATVTAVAWPVGAGQ